jgi:preprotein translocase SecE subunit
MLDNIKKPFKIIFDFFKEVVHETRQVDYLSRKKTFRYTLLTLVSLLTGIVFLVLVDNTLFDVRNLILQF